jgi:hypothetical protein
MTLIAGYKCADGAVLCADTQLTVPGLLKYPESKVWMHIGNKRPSLFFAYTGYDDYSHMCMEELTKAISQTPDESDMVRRTKEICRELHQRYHPLYKNPDKLGLELILVIQMTKKVRLLHLRGPIVHTIHTFRCAGSGLFLGHAISRDFYYEAMGIEEAARMAAYVLFRVKGNVDGVGLMSQVFLVSDKGYWQSLKKRDVEVLENVYAEYLRESRSVLLSCGNWGNVGAAKHFEAALGEMSTTLLQRRQEIDREYIERSKDLDEERARKNNEEGEET